MSLTADGAVAVHEWNRCIGPDGEAYLSTVTRADEVHSADE